MTDILFLIYIFSIFIFICGFGEYFFIIDAFIVRLTLVPAVFHLMGRPMWWIPGWLDRILPPLTIEPTIDEGDERAPAS